MALRRMMLVLLLLPAALAPAAGGMVENDACRRDVPLARQTVERSQASLAALGDGRSEICPAWRRHRDGMMEASRVYRRCLTGTDRRVEAARMDGMVADFNDAIGKMCGQE
jgi:hypothetical protein